MSTEIQEYAFTFGMQYRRPSEFNYPEEQHPQGMHRDGYAVIESPDASTARAIANAIFGDKWAFPYTLAELTSDERRRQFYPDGELLRIAWQTPEMVERILEQMHSIVEGHPATTEPPEREFTPPDMDAELYNELVPFLLEGGTRQGILLAGKIQNLYGASARRRAVGTPTHGIAVNQPMHEGGIPRDSNPLTHPGEGNVSDRIDAYGDVRMMPQDPTGAGEVL